MSADWKLSGVSVAADGELNKQLLTDVNLTFEAGRITLLIGRNGAGKSTLLETIAGIRAIQEGDIELGGDSLWLKESRRKRLNPNVALKLGIAMQSSESQWFAATVREEMLYSLKPYKAAHVDAERRMQQALADAGLAQELLTRDPWTLSGGQQRRLSLACLLACEPEWLLLDEPTAGLDAVGIRRLCAVLEAHRVAGRGAVVATHDLDALLPLADAVAVVSGGTVRAAAPAAAIAHAAAAPQALRALAELRAAAALPPEAPGDGAPWPAPREVAAALAAELERRAGGAAADTSVGTAGIAPTESASTTVQVVVVDNLNLEADERNGVTEHPLKTAHMDSAKESATLLRSDRFDPRALVLVYLFLAASVLAQKSFLELSLATIVTLSLLTPFRALIKPWNRVIRAYVIMIVIFCVIGGIGFGPLDFDWSKVWPIALRFGKLLLIMLLGMPLLKLMSPYRLQRAIEQSLGWLSRLRVPIHSFALVVTLIFRFIPLLSGEWERFAKLAHARGKAAAPLKKVPFKMILSVLIPYMRSILRLAEQMSDALEARGFGYSKQKPTYGFRLQLGRADAWLLSIAATCGLMLFLLSYLL
ncbi:ATP-binding cassette domain-containing protein [Paenibacillus sp. PL91]|uniref:ATP-binding cassette domain-containing protein n=1 Tax=Paenibacillus sp. PL91 TaxID=2729538 RepID=UPI00145DCAA1|nr:ATP-binding cassette domain-containing protein [Paenibacillus sp. PL91]MBC9199481.1 ATP-binding cassette domain-containing protein [Paenibacillus sp. PL91]